VKALSNGNYVVISYTLAGAVTGGMGPAGLRPGLGSHSLVGDSGADQVGAGGVTLLSNGNYVVKSHLWDNGTAYNVGRSPGGMGKPGLRRGLTANSLVGSTTNDEVSGVGVTPLSNGSYVVLSPLWNNAAAAGCRSKSPGEWHQRGFPAPSRHSTAWWAARPVIRSAIWIRTAMEV